MMKSLPLSLALMVMLSMFSAASGMCPNPAAKATIDFGQLSSDAWWDFQRFTDSAQFDTRCSSVTYTVNPSGTLTIDHSGKSNSLNGPGSSSIEFIDNNVMVDPKTPGALEVSLGGVSDGSPNYFILDTDYANYALVYSCYESGDGNKVSAWILSRPRGVAPANLENLRGMLQALGIAPTALTAVDQTNC